jgi:hypothetical protein
MAATDLWLLWFVGVATQVVGGLMAIYQRVAVRVI